MPRKLGPNEYDNLRNRYKVGPSNFDQYFIRSGGDILVKDQYDPNAGMSSPTSTSVPPVSETGSPTDFNFNLGTDTQSQSSLLGKAVTELLKSYQGIEKYPFAEKELAASDLQAKRLSFTDPNMIGASPGQQAAVRGASAAAVQPTISGAQQAGQTFASRLATFGDVLGQVQNIQQQQMIEEQNTKAEAQNIITMALNANPAIFDNVDPKQLAQLEKASGYGSGFISQLANAMKLSQQQQLAQQAPQTMETAEGIFQWNPTTGQWEASGLRGEPSTSIIESGGRQLLINAETGETIRDLGAVKGPSYAPQAKQAVTDASGNVVGYFNPSTGQTEYYEGMEPQQPMSLQEFAQQLGEQRQQSIDPNSVQGEYQDYLSNLNQGQISSNVQNYIDDGYAIVDSSWPQALNVDGKYVQKLKPLTDSATKSLSQFSDVKTQVDGIKKYAADAGMFDPITGQFRNINPYDAKAQQLNRMIIAVVPSLARGVFGEVGVLTDTDVERYTKLLPNVKTPSDQITEALNFLTQRLDSSYVNFLNTYKSAGYDVRGFDAGQQNMSYSGTTSSGMSYQIIQ